MATDRPLYETTELLARESDAAHQTAVDRDVLNSLRGLEPGLLGRIIDMYLRSVPGMLQTLRAAIVEGDPKRVETTAHQLRGSSLNLGAVSMASLCEELEHHGCTGLRADTQEVLVKLELEYERTRRVLAAAR